MKEHDNLLILKMNGKDEKFKIILKVKSTDDETYFLYTKNELNETDETIVYAGKLIESEKGELLEPINDDETLEILSKLLMQMEEKTNKEAGN
ncbi:MAG: DUF1292 domain-containing protein [Bacilli bacterium]